MIIQVFNRDIMELLTIFSISPGSKFARKDLKERTKLNNINLDNALNILSNSNLIKKEKRLLMLNLDASKQIIKLISDEYKALKELPLNAYFSIASIIFFLSKSKNIHAFLFGSFAKLVYNENSDIDIAIVSDRIKEKEKKELNKMVQKLESRYGKNIEVHYFGMDFYKNKKDPLVRDIIVNGVRMI